VMVSGACHGDQFATALQCGFFAAHPDVVASGCESSPEGLGASDDYLQLFFRAASGTATEGTRLRNRRPPTLHDAHWYAALRLEDQQLPYTTTDALIDAYFAANPQRLPPSLTVAEIQGAARTLSRAEADAAVALTAGLALDLAIPLSGYVEANHALPYKRVLPLLARRIAYAALEVPAAEFTVAASCEQRTLTDFLGAER